MPGTFSVPARRRRSCPLPLMSGSTVTPSRNTSAPTPVGPPILCAARLNRSTPSAAISSLTRPAACTASVCMTPPALLTIFAVSATGWIAPVSLLAAIKETNGSKPFRWGFASSVSSLSRSITPSLVTGRRVASGVASTEVCSTADTNTRQPSPACASANAFASVPPLVNITLSAGAPTSLATLPRAASTAARARRPSSCTEDGLPSSDSASITSVRTSSLSGAVAL